VKLWIFAHTHEVGACDDSDWTKLVAAPTYARAKDIVGHHVRVRIFEVGLAHQGVSEGLLMEQDYIFDYSPLSDLGASRKRQ
jgi:hypothetical protein